MLFLGYGFEFEQEQVLIVELELIAVLCWIEKNDGFTQYLLKFKSINAGKLIPWYFIKSLRIRPEWVVQPVLILKIYMYIFKPVKNMIFCGVIIVFDCSNSRANEIFFGRVHWQWSKSMKLWCEHRYAHCNSACIVYVYTHTHHNYACMGIITSKITDSSMWGIHRVYLFHSGAYNLGLLSAKVNQWGQKN